MSKSKKVRAFLCSTDWSIEAFHAPEMPEVYRTIAQLKKARSCWRECGITEVEIVKKRTRHKGDGF